MKKSLYYYDYTRNMGNDVEIGLGCDCTRNLLKCECVKSKGDEFGNQDIKEQDGKESDIRKDNDSQ